MGNMQISKNAFNRFDIGNIEDEGIKKNGQIVKGIAGYHGPLANILGWILEKIFHKTVAVSGKDGIYYLNCQSLAHFLNRFDAKEYADVKDLASKAHSSTWVEGIIKRVVDANQKKEELQKQLLQAIDEKDVEKCKELLQQGASAKTVSSRESPLHRALEKSLQNQEIDYVICRLLIEHGADINARDRQGKLPLEVAINKNEKVVCLFVMKGANLNLKPSNSENFLEYIEKIQFEDEERKEIIKKLLDPTFQEKVLEVVKSIEKELELKIKKELELKLEQKKVREAEQKENEQYEEMRQAVLGGRLSEFKDLLSKGYKPEVGLLHTAVNSNYGDLKERLEICELLVANGVGVNDRDRSDALPIEQAIRGLNAETVEWLINKGANLNAKPSRYEEVETLFELAKKRQFYNEGSEGERRARIFALLGHADYIEQEKTEKEFGNKLSGGNVEEIKKFIETSLSAIKPLSSGDFPLRRATFNPNICFEVCGHLLAKGAKDKINEKQGGELPLEWAIYQNDPNLVQLFIDNGANIHLKGSKDRTLIEIAKKRKRQKENSFEGLDKNWDANHAEILKKLGFK